MGCAYAVAVAWRGCGRVLQSCTRALDFCSGFKVCRVLSIQQAVRGSTTPHASLLHQFLLPSSTFNPRLHLHKMRALQIVLSSLNLPSFLLRLSSFLWRIIHSLSSGFKLFIMFNLFSQVSPLSDPLTGLMQVSSPKLLHTKPAKSCGHPSFPVDQ